MGLAATMAAKPTRTAVLVSIVDTVVAEVLLREVLL